MPANLTHARKDMHRGDVRCSLTNTLPTSPLLPCLYMQCQLDDGNVYGLLSPFSHQTIFVHSPFTSLTTVILSIKPAKNSSLARFLNGNCFLVCCFPLLQGRSVLLQPLQFYPPWEKLHHLLHLKCCCKFAEMFFTATCQQARPRQPGGQWPQYLFNLLLLADKTRLCLSNGCRRLLDSGQHARVHHVACGLAQKDDE